MHGSSSLAVNSSFQEASSMKLMSDLESFRIIYPNNCLYALYYAALQYNLSDFKFRGITKNAGNFGRDLGAKFSLNDPKK